MQARNQKCSHIKLGIIIIESSVSVAFNIICILFYCGLYTMAIHLKNNKKNGAFDLFTCVIFNGSQFLRYFFKNYAGCHVSIQILYIYI